MTGTSLVGWPIVLDVRVWEGRLRGSVRTVTSSFRPSALTHLLVVADTSVSRDWYVDVLEASVYGEYGDSVVLDLFGNWILLVTGSGPTNDKPDVTMAPPDDPQRASAEIIFRVDDCRGLHHLLLGRGAEFLTEPVDRGGEIRCFFRDPDGHLFEISELVAS